MKKFTRKKILLRIVLHEWLSEFDRIHNGRTYEIWKRQNENFSLFFLLRFACFSVYVIFHRQGDKGDSMHVTDTEINHSKNVQLTKGICETIFFRHFCFFMRCDVVQTKKGKQEMRRYGEITNALHVIHKTIEIFHLRLPYDVIVPWFIRERVDVIKMKILSLKHKNNTKKTKFVLILLT